MNWTISDETLAEALRYAIEDIHNRKSFKDIIDLTASAYSVEPEEAKRIVNLAKCITLRD